MRLVLLTAIIISNNSDECAMSTMELIQLGWRTHFERQLDERTGSPVRIMEVQKSGWQVRGDGIDTIVQPALKGEPVAAAVGDWLLLDRNNNRATVLLERKSLFKRRAPGTDSREQLIAANVDTVFVVSSCNQDFNEARIERYLALAREAQVMAVIVLTKADLSDDPADYVQRAYGLAAGIVVEAVDAHDAGSLGSLDSWLNSGETVALLGSSGVGKSTMTNTLLGEASISTAGVRPDDGKGRHTTTARSMHLLPGGAWLLDMPGMRELQLADVKDGIDDVFDELSSLAADCRFTDCSHQDEPGCAVADAIQSGEVSVDRLQRWRKLMREDARNSESISERRARDRATGRLYKDTIGDAHHKKGRGQSK